MKTLAILLMLLPAVGLCDSSVVTGSGKLSATAQVDFKIIIPLIVGVNDGKAFSNASKNTALTQKTTCDSNNVCTVTTP